MKRLFTLATLAAMVGVCSAQSIAIRQPLEGAKIRETTSIRIPSRGIPASSYIGIFVNSKFVEAVSPELDHGDYVYKLDTKGLHLADGPATVEAVLYLSLGDDHAAQVIGRTSVNVTIDNSSIAMPADGYDLKYRFRPGMEMKYDLNADATVSQVSQAEALMGSKGFEQPREHDQFRFMEAVDQSYRNGDGLVRIQPLPDRNRSYAFVRLASEGNAVRKVTQNEMTPMYLRMTDKGREVFGGQEPYFGLDGTSGSITPIQVFLELPNPVLPTKKVKPGDVWQGAFSLPTRLTSDQGGHVATLIPARGTFEAVEYMNGVACARIRTTVQSGAADLTNLNNLGFDSGQNQSLKLESTMWLGINTGVIEKQEIDLTQEAIVDGGGAAATGPSMGGRMGGGVPPSGSSAPPAGRGGQDFTSPQLDPTVGPDGKISLFQGMPPGYDPRRGGLPPSGGPPGSYGGGRPGAYGGGAPGTATGGQTNGGGRLQRIGKQIIRVSFDAIIELEK